MLEQREKELMSASIKEPSKLAHVDSLINATAKLVQQKLDVDNNSVIQKCTIDFSIYEKLEMFLASHVQLALSSILKDGKPILFNEFAAPSEGWSCCRCECPGNPEAAIQCAKCSSLRGIESLPNLLYNPEQITEREVEIFKNRRAFEKQMICARDLITPEVFKTDGSWYLISADWLKMWKAYVFNKPNKKSVINKAVGVLPPGPICNEKLVLPDGKTPRQGLEKVSCCLKNRILIIGESMNLCGKRIGGFMEEDQQ